MKQIKNAKCNYCLPQTIDWEINYGFKIIYWFIFYSERMNKTWILSSKEFIKESNQNKKGKNVGKRSIWFNGKNTKEQTEHVKPQFEKYLVNNFRRIKDDNPDK